MIAAQESITAKLCAFARAYHSNLGKEKIFDDYLAYDMMGEKEYDQIVQFITNNYGTAEHKPKYGFESTWVFEEMNRYFSPIALSRIAFAEQALQRFAKSRGSCQYVICGAGLDTFAFRNTTPGIRVFELDHPDTQAHKLERIRQLHWKVPESVKYAAIDFTKDDLRTTLLRAGYDPQEPAFFSILGVTYYLLKQDLSRMVQAISSLSAAGDQLVFDFPDEMTFARNRVERVRELAELTASLGEPMQQGFSTDEIKNILQQQQFYIMNHAEPSRIQKIFFEARLDKQQAFENIHFILAQKNKSEATYIGRLSRNRVRRNPWRS